MAIKITLSTVDKTTEWHRSHFIVRYSDGFYFAEFETGAQFDMFANTVGLTVGNRIKFHEYNDCIFQESELNVSVDTIYFWNKSELPEGVKPIKALSNGSIVTCYYYNDGHILHWYKPNPNASRDIYDPLPVELHQAHCKIYGIY